MDLDVVTSNPRLIDSRPMANRPSCPQCGKNTLVELIQAMRRYGGADDWFRCDKCDRLFTQPRPF
jgi:hypothetical protein